MPTASQRRILFVDDDPKFLQMIERIMRLYGKDQWEVLTAPSASSALALLQEQPVNLVVLDVCMPVVDGLQFLSILNRRHPDLQKVVLTGFASEAYRTACLGNGAELFLEKPRTSEAMECIFATLDELSRWKPEAGFRGVLRRVGLMDVIQMECLGRSSSILAITSPSASGNVYIKDGAIIHAEIDQEKGEKAFFHLLSLGSGDFRLNPYTDPPEQSIDAQWEYLLMEAARLRDEAEPEPAPESLPTQNGATASSAELQPLPAPPPSAPVRVRTEEFLICSQAGDVLHTWQCLNAEQRINFLEFLSQKARFLHSALPLGTFERVEFRQAEKRLLVHIAEDRGVLVRTSTLTENPTGDAEPPSVVAPLNPEAKEHAEQWFQQHLDLAGLLAATLHFPDRTNRHHSAVPFFTAPALETLRRTIVDTLQVLKQQRFPTNRARWTYDQAVVECALWDDATCLMLLFSRNVLDLDPHHVSRVMDDFIAQGSHQSA